jgi:signal transduction histidine kinase
MFVNLFIAQWVVGIILAVIFSPLSWEGSHSAIHPHVYFAIFLGGALAAFPIVIIRFFPANPLNKYVVTTCQMLVSVLLIHLSSGRIETHFHIFGSLAFIAFYRNPRVIILATLITTLDHFLRGIYWPQLIFSTELSSPWRAFEHSAWVIFEDIFLFMSVSDGMRSLKIRARAQLALEDALEKTEQKVRERTSELEESQRLVLEQQQYVVSASKMSSLGEMAAGVAHEINNPLAIISSTTAFLSKSLEKGKMTDHLLKDCLSDIEQTVRRISKIVLGLRNVSRDSNAEEDDLVVIQDIFDDVLAISAEKFKNHGIELEIIDESGLL